MQIGLFLDDKQIILLQRLSTKRIGFSLTESCPAKCEHCMVSSVNIEDKSRTMTIDQVVCYISQLESLRKRGLRSIFFTGGEPFVVPDLLHMFSEAAFAQGFECGVVTSCYWATSLERANQLIKAFPGLTLWDISTDKFHEKFVPLDNIVLAAHILLEQNKLVNVRMISGDPADADDMRIYLELQKRLPDEVPIFIAPVMDIGRGTSIISKKENSNCTNVCIPGGLIVRYDGTISPCCSALINREVNHPFNYDIISKMDIASIYDAWLEDPLMQMIQVVGFKALLQWVEKAYPENEILKMRTTNPCDLCVSLWKKPEIRKELRRLVELPENRAKLDKAYRLIFGKGDRDFA